MKRLLITGATGFIGERLARDLAGRWEVVRLAREPGPGGLACDLEEPGALAKAWESARPDAVAHAAAIADPDDAEREPERARRLNAEAAGELAALCRRRGAALAHLSTDLVFDGARSFYREDDPTGPISVYGRTKLEGERLVLAEYPGAAVLRVCLVYGRSRGKRKSFLDTLVSRLGSGQPLRAFRDQWRTPTANALLPDTIDQVLRRGLSGVLHWGGADRVSRWEFALEVCRVFGFDERLAQEAPAAEAAWTAPRPADVSLDSSRLAGLLGARPWTLREGLEKAKAEFAQRL